MQAMTQAVARRAGATLDPWKPGKVERRTEASKTETKAESKQQEKQPNDYTEYCKRLQQHIDETDYLTRRGISTGVIHAHAIGYTDHYKGLPGGAVVFFSDDCHSYNARNVLDTGDRYRNGAGDKKQLWNAAALDGSRPVYVTEGIIDALSIETVGGVACSPLSAGDGKLLLEAIDERMKAGKAIPPILVCFDDDDPGKKAAAGLLDDLAARHVYAIDAREVLALDCKDANESLQKDPEWLRISVKAVEAKAVEEEAAARQRLQDEADRAAGLASAYVDVLKEQFSQPLPPLSTGFPQLDGLLGGGLYPGMYIVGALSGAGKTTFCLQVAENLAAVSRDVLYISLEMSRAELVAKAVSRHTYQIALERTGWKPLQQGGDEDKDTEAPLRDMAMSARDVMTGARWKYLSDVKRDVLQEAFETFKQRAGRHLYIIESVGATPVDPPEPTTLGQAADAAKVQRTKSIREYVQEITAKSGRPPVVVIDYLQILATPDPRLSDKQATDRNIFALKQLQREYSLAIIGISSLNRQNYTEPATMAALKESGSLEYTSDSVLIFQPWGYDLQELEKPGERAKRLHNLHEKNKELKKAGRSIQVQLKILKNRFGATDSQCYDFYGRYGLYCETFGEPLGKSEMAEAEAMFKGVNFDETPVI